MSLGIGKMSTKSAAAKSHAVHEMDFWMQSHAPYLVPQAAPPRPALSPSRARRHMLYGICRELRAQRACVRGCDILSDTRHTRHTSPL